MSARFAPILLATLLFLSCKPVAADDKRELVGSAPSARAKEALAVKADTRLDTHTPPKPGKLHIFGDWIVGCDNMGECTATSILPEEDDAYDQNVGMSVGGALGHNLGVRFNLQFASGGKTGAGTLVMLRRRSFRLDYSGGMENSDAAVFSGLSFRGESIIIINSAGRPIGQVSSKGLDQAIAHLKAAREKYRRNPPIAPVIRNAYQQSARSLPVAEAQIARLRRELQRRNSDCETDGADNNHVEPLDADHSVFFVTCWAGTANQLFAVYVARRTRAGIVIEPAEYDYPAHGPDDLFFINTHAGVENSAQGWLHQTFGGGGADNPHSYGPMMDYVWDGRRFRLAKLIEASSLERGFHDEITTWSAEVVP